MIGFIVTKKKEGAVHINVFGMLGFIITNDTKKNMEHIKATSILIYLATKEKVVVDTSRHQHAQLHCHQGEDEGGAHQGYWHAR